jgi:hypothetical protein
VKQQTWVCVRCDEVYRTPLPASEVRCKKNHRMVIVQSEADLAREKAREGVK